MNVSNEVRETYISWSAGLPERDERNIRAGEWDKTTGMQVLAKFEAEITQRVRDEALEEAAIYLINQAMKKAEMSQACRSGNAGQTLLNKAELLREEAAAIRQMIGGGA